jgi:hypothetical protein
MWWFLVVTLFCTLEIASCEKYWIFFDIKQNNKPQDPLAWVCEIITNAFQDFQGINKSTRQIGDYFGG